MSAVGELPVEQMGSMTTKIWNDKSKKALASIEISSQDFVQVISLLISHAESLVKAAPREWHVYDTVPGGLANSLVHPLGYKNAGEFLRANEDYPF